MPSNCTTTYSEFPKNDLLSLRCFFTTNGTEPMSTHADLIDVTQLNNIRMFCLNVSGMRTKLSQFYAAIANCDYDVIIVLESWLSSSILDAELTPSGWTCYRRDRHRHSHAGHAPPGGGILIMVRSSLPSHQVAPENDIIEQLWVKIILSDRNLFVGGAYIPPRSSDETYDLHASFCQQVLQSTDELDDVVIFSDLNLPNVIWSQHDELESVFVATNISSHAETAAFDNMAEGLFQLNGCPNSHSNVLDTIFCSRYDNVEVACPAPPLCAGFGTTHAHIPLSFTYSSSSTSSTSNTRRDTYNFKRANYPAIINALNDINWDTLICINDVNAATDKLYQCVNKIIEKYTPKKVSRKHHSRPWMSDSLIRLRNRKRAAGKRAQFSKSLHHQQEYARLNEVFTDINAREYADYFIKQGEKLKDDPKSFWKFINERRNCHDLPSLMTLGDQRACGDAESANLIANHFRSTYRVNNSPPEGALLFTAQSAATDTHLIAAPFTEDVVLQALLQLDVNKGAGPDLLPPRFWKSAATALCKPLTIIFNMSIESGCFPRHWKEATVVPVHKSGLRSKVENYRPISILSCPGKVFDYLMCGRLTDAFANVIGEQQHGFVKGRSTTSNLVEFVSNVTNLVEGGQQIDALYLDFSKAFDSLDHGILVGKLLKYGLDNKSVAWFTSYLDGRQLRVRTGTSLSDPFRACSGVPQGSHLGPLLFLVYIQDLIDELVGTNASFFADDLKIYQPISKVDDCSLLQSHLNRVAVWSRTNCLSLNAKKCQTISFSRRHTHIDFTYSVDGVNLQRVSTVKDLGVHIDSKLTFKTHIDFIVAKCYSTLGLIRRFGRNFNDIDVMRSLYCTLVRPLIEYASPTWSSHLSTYTARLESCQKRFLAIALGTIRQPGSYAQLPYLTRLAQLKLDTIEDRLKLSSVMLIFDVLNGRIACPVLMRKITINSNRTGRHGHFLYADFHRTGYGMNEPINMGVTHFNNVADIYKICIAKGYSRNWFKKWVTYKYRTSIASR